MGRTTASVIRWTALLVLAYLVVTNADGVVKVIRQAGFTYGGSIVKPLQGR